MPRRIQQCTLADLFGGLNTINVPRGAEVATVGFRFGLNVYVDADWGRAECEVWTLAVYTSEEEIPMWKGYLRPGRVGSAFGPDGTMFHVLRYVPEGFSFHAVPTPAPVEGAPLTAHAAP